MNQGINKIVEALPVISFFIAYWILGFQDAIKVLVGVSAISFVVSWGLVKKISYVQLFATIMVIVFGGISIISNDPVFLKVKVSILNLIWAIILGLDLFVLKKMFLKKILGAAITLPNQAWRALTKGWMLFFIFCAGLNEVVWRNCTDEQWIYFKVFGLISLTLIFTVFNVIYLKKRYVNAI